MGGFRGGGSEKFGREIIPGRRLLFCEFGRLAGGGRRLSRDCGILGWGGGPRLNGSKGRRDGDLEGDGATAGVGLVTGSGVAWIKLNREGNCVAVVVVNGLGVVGGGVGRNAGCGGDVGRKAGCCCCLSALSRFFARMLDLTRGALPSGRTSGPKGTSAAGVSSVLGSTKLMLSSWDRFNST